MATCSLASLAQVTSPCGSSSRDPQEVQCITLSECNEDVSTHLKKLNVGPDTINDEKTLLLARAGAVIIHYCSGLSLLTFVFFLKWTDYLYRLTNVSGIFTADQGCHLAMTVCPHHREIYGLRWRSGKVRCCVPIEVAGHKDPKTKGDRGLNSRESSFILVTLGELHSVGSGKSSK